MFKKVRVTRIALLMVVALMFTGCFGLFKVPEPSFEVTGVEDGKVYTEPVTPVINAGKGTTLTITLNDEPFESGTTINQNGEYELVVVGTNKKNKPSTRKINFTIELNVPIITMSGVEDKGYYWEEITPEITTDNEKDTIEAWINEESYTIGTPLNKNGTYTLRVKATNEAGNSWETSITFEIRLGYPPTLEFNPVAKEGGGIVGMWKDRQGDISINEDPTFIRTGDASIKISAGWPVVIYFNQYNTEEPHPDNVKDWSAYDKISLWFYFGNEEDRNKLADENTLIIEVTEYVKKDKAQILPEIGEDGWYNIQLELTDIFKDGIVLDDNQDPLKITLRAPQGEVDYYLDEVQLIMSDKVTP